MSTFIEVREVIKRIYGKYDAYINPVLKFLLAFIVFSVINSKLGYMEKLDRVAIVLVVSLLSSILPMVVMALFAGLFILLHLYALALECAIVAAFIMFLMFILFVRFAPGESVVVLLTPILFLLKIPYVIPIAVGLFGGPFSIFSVACGVVVANVVEFMSENGATIVTVDDGNMVSRIRFIIDGLLADKGMIVMCIAFAVTLVVVYVIRRRAIDFAWTIAIVAGAIVDMVILLFGDLKFDLNYSIGGLLFGGILAILLCLVLQFFSFHLDYKSTEDLQFEDDDYYYYVKAVPKITVAAANKKVKRINTASAPNKSASRPASQRPAQRPQAKTVHTANGTTKTVRKPSTQQPQDLQ